MSTSPRSPAVRRKHRTYCFHLPILSRKSSSYPLLPPAGNGMLPCLLRQRYRNTIRGASPKRALSEQCLRHAGSFQDSRLSSFGIEALPSMAVYLNRSLRESTCACLARRTYPQLRTLFYDIGGGTQSGMRGRSGAVAQKSDPGRVQPRSREFAREPESP